MADRYTDRFIFRNSSTSYRSVFEQRAVKGIDQFATGRFSYPTPEQIKNLKISKHIWKTGDHYYKLADRFYGDTSYWWAIAFFNLKPTEADLQYGDVVYIPFPLERLLEYYNAR